MKSANWNSDRKSWFSPKMREFLSEKKTRWLFDYVDKSHLAWKFVKLGIGGTIFYHEFALNVKKFQPETLEFVFYVIDEDSLGILRPNLQNSLRLGWTKIIGIYCHDPVNRWNLNLTTLRNDKNFDDSKIVIRKVDVLSTMALLVLKNLGEGTKLAWFYQKNEWASRTLLYFVNGDSVGLQKLGIILENEAPLI